MAAYDEAVTQRAIKTPQENDREPWTCAGSAPAPASAQGHSHSVAPHIPWVFTRTNKEMPLLYVGVISLITRKKVGRSRWLPSISRVAGTWEGRWGLQDLSSAGRGSVISRRLVTFWKEGKISETTKLLSALIWPRARNSCESWLLQEKNKKITKTRSSLVIMWFC